MGAAFSHPTPLPTWPTAFPCCPGGALSGGLVVGSHRRSEQSNFAPTRFASRNRHRTARPYQRLLVSSLVVVVSGTEHSKKPLSPQRTEQTALHGTAALHLIPDIVTDNSVLWRSFSALRSTRTYLLWPRDNDQAELWRPARFGAPSLAKPATGLQSATFKLLPELQPLVVAQSSAQILPSPIGAVVGTSLNSRHRRSSEAQLSSISALAVSARRTDARQMHPQTNTNSTCLDHSGPVCTVVNPGAAERQVEAEVEVGARRNRSSPSLLPPASSPLYFQSVGDILGATSPQISPTC